MNQQALVFLLYRDFSEGKVMKVKKVIILGTKAISLDDGNNKLLSVLICHLDRLSRFYGST